MKKSVILTMVAIVVAMLSCKKGQMPAVSPHSLTVKFRLYTDKDLSDDSNNIIFSIFIRKKNTTLFDSTLATIKIKDIPDAANAWVYEKKIHNNNSILIAGFRYVIENVGNSSHSDTISANEESKLIDYPFH
ncbi:hypothetical protein [Mucilaginibacter panaciglaebae]|uniref:Uncharacterized protein n=1 Tax=Mucilaginibacter panaciglaebae TaxID=502331 RepID=A0ABP7WRQ7_9SPHI